MGIKNGPNGANGASFSVQSKIFPKIKAKIFQIRYQNVQEGSSFSVERKNSEIFNVSCFYQSKIIFFFIFKA